MLAVRISSNHPLFKYAIGFDMYIDGSYVAFVRRTSQEELIRFDDFLPTGLAAGEHILQVSAITDERYIGNSPLSNPVTFWITRDGIPVGYDTDWDVSYTSIDFSAEAALCEKQIMLTNDDLFDGSLVIFEDDDDPRTHSLMGTQSVMTNFDFDLFNVPKLIMWFTNVGHISGENGSVIYIKAGEEFRNYTLDILNECYDPTAPYASLRPDVEDLRWTFKINPDQMGGPRGSRFKLSAGQWIKFYRENDQWYVHGVKIPINHEEE